LGRTPGLENVAQEKQLNGRVVEGRQRTGRIFFGGSGDLNYGIVKKGYSRRWGDKVTRSCW
jgi:hypothetical protein